MDYLCGGDSSVWEGETLHLKLLYSREYIRIEGWKEKCLEIDKIDIALAALPWCAYICTLLWAVACVHRQRFAQDLLPSNHRIELLLEGTKAVKGKGLKPALCLFWELESTWWMSQKG